MEAQIQEPFKVNVVILKFEAQFYNPTTGKTTRRGLSEDIPIYEADFFPGLIEFLQSKGAIPPSEPKAPGV